VPLTDGREPDDTRAILSFGPTTLVEAVQQGLAPGPRQMGSTLAPVKAGFAERAAGLSECIRVDPEFTDENASGVRQFNLVTIFNDIPLRPKRVEHADARSPAR
jgi:hypothetical protein